MGNRHHLRVKKFTCSVPQGTVFGLLLFNIFMEINRSGAHHYFYADDLTIVVKSVKRRVPDFLREDFLPFDGDWDRHAGATLSAISPLQKLANKARVLS